MNRELKVVGIDVSKARLDVCVLPEGAASSQANDEAGIVGLVEALKRLRPDLVHAWMFAANGYGFAAARACGVRHFVAAQRCVDPWKGRLQLALDRALARRCSCTAVTPPRR